MRPKGLGVSVLLKFTTSLLVTLGIAWEVFTPVAVA